MAKDTLLDFCNCPEKVFIRKKYAGQTIIVCANCDHTMAVVAKENEHMTIFHDFINENSRTTIQKAFIRDPEKLKEALEIKNTQEEIRYKHRVDKLD